MYISILDDISINSGYQSLRKSGHTGMAFTYPRFSHLRNSCISISLISTAIDSWMLRHGRHGTQASAISTCDGQRKNTHFYRLKTYRYNHSSSPCVSAVVSHHDLFSSTAYSSHFLSTEPAHLLRTHDLLPLPLQWRTSNPRHPWPEPSFFSPSSPAHPPSRPRHPLHPYLSSTHPPPTPTPSHQSNPHHH